MQAGGLDLSRNIGKKLIKKWCRQGVAEVLCFSVVV